MIPILCLKLMTLIKPGPCLYLPETLHFSDIELKMGIVKNDI